MKVILMLSFLFFIPVLISCDEQNEGQKEESVLEPENVVDDNVIEGEPDGNHSKETIEVKHDNPGIEGINKRPDTVNDQKQN